MRWWFVVLVLVCSCTFRKVDQAPNDGTTDGPGRDGGPIDATPDGPPPAIMCNAAMCQAAAGNGTGICDPVTNHCRIMTVATSGIICPAGYFCDITCGGAAGCQLGQVNCMNAAGCTVACGAGGNADTACDSGVLCPATGPCTVMCNGGDTCRHAPVTCGAGPCDVQCIGVNACGDFGVDCKASSKCDVRCEGNNACLNGGVACGPGTCNVTYKGNNACQNLPATCTAATPPTQCAFHCCGLTACTSGTLCSTCTKDAVCP